MGHLFFVESDFDLKFFARIVRPRSHIWWFRSVAATHKEFRGALRARAFDQTETKRRTYNQIKHLIVLLINTTYIESVLLIVDANTTVVFRVTAVSKD